MPNHDHSRGLVVSKSDAGEITRRFQTRELPALEPKQVRIRVQFSALNYKDALALSGNPGVIRQFPLIPGIDAVGSVVESHDERLKIGDDVLIQHSHFGTSHPGGYQQFVEVPGDWCLRRPEGLGMLEWITLGTAGFTAAQCCEAIVSSGLEPGDGEVVVTGATGGVGVFSVMLLSHLGYSVVAATGKPDNASWLRERGAARIIPRSDLIDSSGRPLLSAMWSGAVDTVGGETLSTVIRSMHPHRTATCCGLVGGHELPLTVYPFILRGVTLVGIDSALLSREQRERIWQRLATDWKLPEIESLSKRVSIEQLESEMERILAGKISGRVIVEP